MSLKHVLVIQNMWAKTVCIWLEQIERSDLMVCWVACQIPLVRSPLWCHFITFTCSSLFNQESHSPRTLWSKYKAIKLILESVPIQVDPFLTHLWWPKAARLWTWGFADEKERSQLLLQGYTKKGLPIKSLGYLGSNFIINEVLF